MSEVCACGEETGGGVEAAPAASLMILETGNSLGEKRAIWKAALRLVWRGKTVTAKREMRRGVNRKEI